MAERRQLPPQIRRVEIKQRGSAKPVICYQLTVDTGYVDGKRKQLRRRYETEQEARKALAEVQGKVASGTYVQPTKLAVEQAWAQWLASRHRIKPTSAAGYEYMLSACSASDSPLSDTTLRRVVNKIGRQPVQRSAPSARGAPSRAAAGNQPGRGIPIGGLWRAAGSPARRPRLRGDRRPS